MQVNFLKKILFVEWTGYDLNHKSIDYIIGHYRLFEMTKNVPGHIIELGTGSGRNSLIFEIFAHFKWIQRLFGASVFYQRRWNFLVNSFRNKVLFCSTNYRMVFNFLMIKSTTGTDTALPANLYNAESDIFGKIYSFGNPCKLKHSRGVNLRIP